MRLHLLSNPQRVCTAHGLYLFPGRLCFNVHRYGPLHRLRVETDARDVCATSLPPLDARCLFQHDVTSLYQRDELRTNVCSIHRRCLSATTTTAAISTDLHRIICKRER